MIGVVSVLITLLLAGITMSGTEPPSPVITILQVLSTAMLCANLIGIALGFLAPETARPENSTRSSVLP